MQSSGVIFNPLCVFINSDMLCLPVNQIQYRNRDQAAFDQLPEHFSGAYAGELICISDTQDTDIPLNMPEKLVSKPHIYHGKFIYAQEVRIQIFKILIELIVSCKAQCGMHCRSIFFPCTFCHSPCGTPSRSHQLHLIITQLFLNIEDHLQYCCFSGSRSSRDNRYRVCECHAYCFRLCF